jgi:hypothetical protein
VSWAVLPGLSHVGLDPTHQRAPDRRKTAKLWHFAKPLIAQLNSGAMPHFLKLLELRHYLPFEPVIWR